MRSTKPSTATADFTDFGQIKGVLAHAGRRGRTYRTYRTYRTAANAALYNASACRALAARSVAVEGLALWACTHCSLWPWKVCPSGCTLCFPGRVSAPYGFIAARGGGSGFNLWGSSKLPSLQTSKLPEKRACNWGGGLLSLMGFVWGCSVPRRRGLRGGYSSLLSRGGPA